MTDENNETLARSLFTPEGKKPAPRRRPAKADGDPEIQEASEDELSKLQALVKAWEAKYQQVQGELESLRPQLASLQAQVEQQAKLIQEQQAAINFWQQKAQTPPTLPTRPHHAVKPLPVPPKPSQPQPPDPLPDFMLD
ncbi:MAG: hypothetical protein Q6K99_08460 [Thermostichales cyanobacterium BF4_bins_65]